jgi:hypothetical protein
LGKFLKKGEFNVELGVVEKTQKNVVSHAHAEQNLVLV